MSWFLARLAEPSSHAGLAALIGAIAGGVTGTLDAVTAAASGMLALIAVLKSDPSHAP